jgi:FkbM family methyltransferase
MQHIDLAAPYRLVFGRHGPTVVNLRDHYVGHAIATYGEYGEVEFELLRQLVRPGRDAAEIGANMGSHTVALARILAAQGRRLLAVEPQPVVFQNLCANISLGALLNVRAENCACADTPGWLAFDTPDYSAVGNFGGVSMHAATQGGQRVRSVPFDDLADASWDFGLLKIDVEGFEQQVLEGARKTIDRCRPIIYLENDRIDKSRELIEWLWAARYRLWYHLPPLFNPANFAGVARDLYPNTISINMIAVPQEMPTDIPGEPVSDAGEHPLRQR